MRESLAVIVVVAPAVMGQSRTKVDEEEGSGFDGLAPAKTSPAAGSVRAHTDGRARVKGRSGVFLAALGLIGPGLNCEEGFQKTPPE